MTKLLQHIEEMRLRLSEIASDEQQLVQALGDALDRLDQQLLHDVRSIASDHELRREEILGELQGLAGGIGMLGKRVAQLRKTGEFRSQCRVGADAALHIENGRRIELVVEVGVEQEERLFPRCPCSSRAFPTTPCEC